MTYPRYIIRPPGIYKTPHLLKEALGAKRVLKYPYSSRKPSWKKDFFLFYPPIEELEEHAEEISNTQRRNGLSSQSRVNSNSTQSWMDRSTIDYSRIRDFSSGTKPRQRKLLEQYGLPIPKTFSTRGESDEYTSRGNREGVLYIARPHRHSGGRGWRITSDPTDWNPQEEYLQKLYKKKYEYRIIMVRGKPLITLIKQVPEGIRVDEPWNHTNGSLFVTVNNNENNRLRHTDIYERLNSIELLKSIDLCGIDVMYKRKTNYVVAEINLCPALQIESNLEKVVNHVHSLS